MREQKRRRELWVNHKGGGGGQHRNGEGGEDGGTGGEVDVGKNDGGGSALDGGFRRGARGDGRDRRGEALAAAADDDRAGRNAYELEECEGREDAAAWKRGGQCRGV